MDDSFRRWILQGAFNAIQEGDYAYVSIRPQFQAMYPSEQHVLYGHVYLILDAAMRDGRVTKLVQVRTILGFWSFRDDGLSISGQATLSIRSTEPGELLCLYEPTVMLDTLPTLDAIIAKAEA